MNINITEILSEDEIKEVVKDELRSRIRGLSKNDLERIINNSAYEVVWQAVDQIYDENACELLRNKVVEQINGFSCFNLFRVPNAWARTPNAPYNTLEKVVLDNKDMLDIKVKEGISKLTKADMKNVALKLVEQKML